MKPLVLQNPKIKQLPSATVLDLNAATTGNASLNMPHGVAPSSPVNGDVWTTSAGVYVRISGVTIGPLGVGGTSGIPTLIETLTPAAVASVDIEGFAGGGWALVTMVMDLIVSVDNAAIQANYKLNGAYATSGDYRRRASASSSGGSNTTSDTNAGVALLLSMAAANFGVGNDTLETFTSLVRIPFPDNAIRPKMAHIESEYIGPTGSLIHMASGGTFTGAHAATALQGLRVAVSSGTMTGTIKVFGQK